MFDNNQETTTTTLTVTNRTINESCFGIEIGSGFTVYIPASISIRANLSAGDLLTADVIPNPVEGNRERTPYMAVNVAPWVATSATSATPATSATSATPATQEPEAWDPFEGISAEEAREFTQKLILDGDCWNNRDVFCELMDNPEAVREDNTVAYNAIGHEMRRIFNAGKCSKFVLFRKSSQTKASAEWFTCRPDKCEPMSWSENDAR